MADMGSELQLQLHALYNGSQLSLQTTPDMQLFKTNVSGIYVSQLHCSPNNQQMPALFGCTHCALLVTSNACVLDPVHLYIQRHAVQLATGTLPLSLLH